MSALAIALLENKKNAKQVTACLAQCGHETIVVDSFAKAKDLLLTQPCGLIISDVHLENGGSVFDFLRWVKDSPAPLNTIPFVLLSVEPTKRAKYLGEGVRMAARHLGAAKYISMEKFDVNILSEQLSDLFLKPSVSPDQIIEEEGK
jgi:CheY-like chemotaxis protein